MEEGGEGEAKGKEGEPSPFVGDFFKVAQYKDDSEDYSGTANFVKLLI